MSERKNKLLNAFPPFVWGRADSYLVSMRFPRFICRVLNAEHKEKIEKNMSGELFHTIDGGFLYVSRSGVQFCDLAFFDPRPHANDDEKIKKLIAVCDAAIQDLMERMD